MTQKDEQDLLQRAKRQLDQEVENLDGATRSRLNQARHRALSHAGKAFPSLAAGVLADTLRRPWVLPASSIALVGVVILSFTLWNNHALVNKVEPDVLEDIELLGSSEELDFYGDLEFYEWLEDEATAN